MSKILNPKFVLRRGVTIIEVLFAILVTSIGVLAALTLLPVAATQAKRARTADASATAVTAAVGYFDAMGMRRDSVWLAWNAAANAGNGAYLPVQNQIGFSYCIDPRFLAANQPSAVVNSYDPNQFPYTWGAGEPRMMRISFNSGRPDPARPAFPGILTKIHADSVFVFDDDLNYDRDDDATLVAGQIYDTLPASGEISRRRIDGHLSWIATIVPKVNRYSLIPNDEYVLSIVVFYDRPADLAVGDPLHERVLTVAAMDSNGITGGEVLLQTRVSTTQEDADKELGIHTNDWIMLSGISPQIQLGVNPTTSQPIMSLPIPVFKWYRVSDIEAEVTQNGALYERYVTLMGQDWSVPVANTQAVAVEGVVAVVEKTIRLEP